MTPRANPGHQTRGMVLPLTLCLLIVVAMLGAWYLFSVVQSKHSFRVTFRNESARLIAESALAEWRASFFPRSSLDPGLQSLLSDPDRNRAPLPLTSADVPRTSELADRMIGSGRWTLLGTVEVLDVDHELVENVAGVRKRGGFGNEYQGTLRVTFFVGLKNQSQFQTSQFAFEFDLKNLCIRSNPQNRVNRGYTSTALSDYLLFIRDGTGLGSLSSPASRWNGLTIDRSGSSTRGRVYLGGTDLAWLEQSGKIRLADPQDRLESVVPSPPLIGRTGPVDLTRFLPFASPLLQAYRFPSSKELFASPLFEKNVLKLRGIIFVDDARGGLTIPKGMKYEGAGVLISFGDIRIEGDVSRNTPADGPCFIYSWTGSIHANTVEQGRIEASLIALRYNFASGNGPGARSSIDFSRRKAEVFGNVVVDRYPVETMSETEENSLAYDTAALRGDDRYVTTLGGKLRKMDVVFNDSASAEEP